ISGQVRRVTKAIRREMRRRAAIEPVIGHLKQDHRMGRNYLTGRDGDRINAVLAAAGYNFSLLRRWFEDFLRVLLSISVMAEQRCAPHSRARRSSRTTAKHSVMGFTHRRQIARESAGLLQGFPLKSRTRPRVC